MKRRLILSANSVPRLGGQGLNLYFMIITLRRYFDLFVFCQKKYESVETRVVPNSSLGSGIGRVPLLRRLRDWQTFFSDSHFDNYVSNRLPQAAIFQAISGHCTNSIAVAKRQGCATVLDVGTTHIDDFAAEQETECARFGIRPTTTLMKRRILKEYQQADLIRVMSKHAQNTFLERGFSADRVIAVPPPIETSAFPEATFSEPKFRVSFVGLIEPWKGFHYLVEAFSAVKMRDSELVLWGGPGSQPVNQYLREQMARNPAVSVRADMNQVGYGAVYAKSNVLVLPSLSDGFGFVVAEAMASGVPVIVTPNTGAADLVVDGKNGFIVPTRDRDAISDRLLYLAQNPAVLRQMGHAARATARTLTIERFCGRYIPLIESLASGSRGMSHD